jgi:NADH-ubiquinone oxidoreductase chain 2
VGGKKKCQFGHVGYIFIGFSCGTIEGIQSLLIDVFICVSMTINVFAIVLVLNFLSNS